MRAALVGSYAYKDDDFNDIDLISDQEFADSLGANGKSSVAYESCMGIYDVWVPEPDSAHWELLAISDGWPEAWQHVHRVPLVYLAALKKAHLILPHKFLRHIKEYSALKKLLGCKTYIPENYARFIYDLHRTECLARQKKPPSLNTTKEGFFKDVYVYDHDSVHEAVSYPLKPAYTLITNGEIRCSLGKFKSLPYGEKIRCVIEEASVLALERSIIPALYQGKAYIGKARAFEIALMKVCTTITSGWFRDFAIENYDSIKMGDYVTTFLTNGVARQL